MKYEWMQRFMRLAMEVATWSKDPRTQVGAVIVDGKRRVLGLGYNGFPRGVGDRADRYADREAKYKFVVHAEANAILNATRELDDTTLFTTLMPCHECAKLIIQAGITQVFAHSYHESGPNVEALVMFEEAGVNAKILP